MTAGTIDPRTLEGARVATLGRQPIRSGLDAFAARRAVRACAGAIGFDRIAIEELALVASELSTNVVKYGREGALVLERVDLPGGEAAIVIAAEDDGPPFRDFEKAVGDGRDDRGTIPPDALYARAGIGAGLGAVRRFSHALWVEPLERGKRVVAARFVRKTRR